MSVAKVTDACPAAGQPFTTDELNQMPKDGRRYEVLDGALVVSPRPGAPHQVLTARLLGLLLGACPDGMFVISGPVVRLSRTTAFVPDLAVTRHPHPGGKLSEPPLLVVEVRPPGATLVDLDRKKAAYQAFGVRSYWIVIPDTLRPEVIAFAPASGRYEEAGHVRYGEVFRTQQPFPVEMVPARLTAGLPLAQSSPTGISVTP